ncbi:hypothetical protein OVY48_09860 [Sphingobium sp. SA2]|uniref:hypothetical protein n=1 Tax=Sphingobium sp. SA2 TaxID=1524832 RepID=UPI0028C267E6|nr:hypothetical protein [Sphingobium sp. SA2]MDT7533728.1 hypothetical protein [Sphingobium sp. SA2]
MSLKTSLIITGDSSTAVDAVEELKDSIEQLGTRSRTTATDQAALTTATNTTNASARGAIVAQTGVAASTTAVATTSRAAAIAQGALAVGTEVATGAMATFGVSALTVQAILTGGLSLAITAGIAFMTGFASEALSGADALDIEGEAAVSLTDQIDALNDALAREIKTQYASEVAALANAEAHRTLAIQAIKAREALLQKAIAEQKNSPDRITLASPGANIRVNQGLELSASVADLRKQLADAKADLAAREKEIIKKLQPFTERGIAAANDPRERIGLNYEQQRIRLDTRRDQMGETAYARERIKLDQQRTAAVEALNTSERKASATRRSGTAIDREAAQAQKKLQADLEGVIGRYDPARKAASDYADELERIAKLEKAGKISPEDAGDYRAQASAGYLGKVIDWGSIKPQADDEKELIEAAGAIDKIVQSIEDETAALGALTPVQRVQVQYRKELAALAPEEREAAAQRIADAQAEKDATEDIKHATEDAQRAKEQLARTAIDAFTAIAVGGQKASDVISRLAESIAAAAIEATLFGTGPMAALLNGAVAPDAAKSGGGVAGLAAEPVGKSIAKELEGSLDRVFGEKGAFGKTMRNAGLGYAAGGATGSRTGGAIGGMIGGEIGKQVLGSALGSLGSFAGPIGAIAGGLLGGAIGGMLKKTKSGAANITSVDGDAALSGNSEKFKEAASGAASTIQGGLSDIAEMLGGQVGGFNVTIGQRHGDWRVREGAGSLKIKKGAKEFDDDQAGAIGYAIQLAVTQGAIKGLSPAIEKALKSSTDINEALEEALKVQEIEILIGGLGSELAQQFKALETQAKERVRIATQYGFDVVAIEKKNAEDRARLMEDMLEEQVGSLQRLVDEMTSGSMFEGSAIEQRDALLKEIELAKADLVAGKDGAADALASLFQQLYAVSEEAFGTTGQFAADRAMIMDQARQAIAAANAQIAAAAGMQAGATATSDPALKATNQALDENNDQNARLIALLGTLPAEIAARLNGIGYAPLDAASLARTS